MPLMWNNPNRDVRETFIGCEHMAVCLRLFQGDKAGNCPQLEQTGCVNHAVAACLARYLLKKGFVGSTPRNEGQRSIEKQAERLVVAQFLGMRIARIRRAGLEDMETDEIIPASREGGENDECCARENGMICFGRPATSGGVCEDSHFPAADFRE